MRREKEGCYRYYRVLFAGEVVDEFGWGWSGGREGRFVVDVLVLVDDDVVDLDERRGGRSLAGWMVWVFLLGGFVIGSVELFVFNLWERWDNKFSYLEEMDRFFEKYNLAKLI